MSGNITKRFERGCAGKVPTVQQPQVDPLNDAERDWVTAHVAAARRALGESELTPAALDALWEETRGTEPSEQNVGDEHGTEIAVHGPSDFTVFPTNFAARRCETGERHFVEPFVAEVERTLGSLR